MSLGKSSGCDIRCNVPQVVEGDPARLRRVVVNLLGNAVKFTDRGEVSLPGSRYGWIHFQTDPGVRITQDFGGVMENSGPVDDREDKVVDWKVALGRVDEDEALLADLAKLFCEELPKMLSAIQEAVKSRNPAALHRATHALKGPVATFAAQPALDAALNLERLARSADLRNVDEAFAVLLAEVERLRVALEGLMTVRGQS